MGKSHLFSDNFMGNTHLRTPVSYTHSTPLQLPRFVLYMGGGAKGERYPSKLEPHELWDICKNRF